MVETAYTESRSLIIGKCIRVRLGIFHRGKQYPNIVVTNIDYSITSVLFPSWLQFKITEKMQGYCEAAVTVIFLLLLRS